MAKRWREIRRCGSAQEAEALRATLVEQGIDAVVPDAHVMGVQPLCSKGTSGARLLVLDDHVESARAILEGGGSWP